MNKILTLIFAVLFLAAFISAALLNDSLSKTVEQLKQAENNTKALLLAQDSLTATNRTLKLSIEQLNFFNDSISKVLNKAIKESKKDKNKISQLQYAVSTNFKIDTVRFVDTLFIENTNIDTTITDSKWYYVNLKLKSPDLLVVSPSFKNELITIFNYKKETINPPKKCFIGRWFQKKHIVTETTIINNNPYSTVDTTRVVEIVKL